MPQKTIYVKDENVELFEKAEKLSGKKFSELVADLVKDYVLNLETSGKYYAICFVDKTETGVPTFKPEYFIKIPRGLSLFEVREYVDEQVALGKREAHIIYPLLGSGEDHEEKLKMKLVEGRLDVVELTE